MRGGSETFWLTMLVACGGSHSVADGGTDAGCVSALCDDGDPCTEDRCFDGACAFEPIVCEEDGDGCTRDICVEGTRVHRPCEATEICWSFDEDAWPSCELPLSLAVESEEPGCVDLAAEGSFVMRARGPAAQLPETRQGRPGCAISTAAPGGEFPSSLRLDLTGHGEERVVRGPGRCDEPLLGTWEVWLRLGDEVSERVELTFYHSACPAVATCSLARAMSGTECGGACVDTRVDRANCGACGRGCAVGEACLSGECVVAPDHVACGGVLYPRSTALVGLTCSGDYAGCAGDREVVVAACPSRSSTTGPWDCPAGFDVAPVGLIGAWAEAADVTRFLEEDLVCAHTRFGPDTSGDSCSASTPRSGYMIADYCQRRGAACPDAAGCVEPASEWRCSSSSRYQAPLLCVR